MLLSKFTHRGGLTPSFVWRSLLSCPPFYLTVLFEVRAHSYYSLSVLSLHCGSVMGLSCSVFSMSACRTKQDPHPSESLAVTTLSSFSCSRHARMSQFDKQHGELFQCLLSFDYFEPKIIFMPKWHILWHLILYPSVRLV